MEHEPIPFTGVGAGSRGRLAYGVYIERHPGQAKVVVVANPDDFTCENMAVRQGIAGELRFADVRGLLKRPRPAEAGYIATTDRLHATAAVLAVERGDHILLEKPLALTGKECTAITRCMDCSHAEKPCRSSAKRFFFKRPRGQNFGWLLNMVTRRPDERELEAALPTGPYESCVYRCSTDVLDTPITAFACQGDLSASLTLSAFKPIGRPTRIMGSHAYRGGDDRLTPSPRVWRSCSKRIGRCSSPGGGIGRGAWSNEPVQIPT